MSCLESNPVLVMERTDDEGQSQVVEFVSMEDNMTLVYLSETRGMFFDKDYDAIRRCRILTHQGWSMKRNRKPLRFPAPLAEEGNMKHLILTECFLLICVIIMLAGTIQIIS